MMSENKENGDKNNDHAYLWILTSEYPVIPDISRNVLTQVYSYVFGRIN